MKQKILHLSFSDSGGAGKAALRLCSAQASAGMDASMLVASQNTHSKLVNAFYPNPGAVARLQRELRNRTFRNKIHAIKDSQKRSGYPYSPEGSPHRNDLVDTLAKADVIHLHWVARFLFLPLLNSPQLADKRFIWTLHDFHPVTGGCHYPGSCERYTSGCGQCPLLEGNDENDLSSAEWNLRQKTFAELGDRLDFVAPSAWLARKAEQSGVTGGRRVHVIRNPLDLDCFRPHAPEVCHQLLGLPNDRPLVLFVSDSPEDQRKGGDLIRDIISKIREGINAHFVSVGSERAFSDISDHTPLGMIADDRLLAMIYAAADVFLMPSRDDNLPNTVIESLSCGTPVVCFDVGGAPELIEDGSNGARVPLGDTESMAMRVVKLLKDPSLERIRLNCRKTAENAVAPDTIARQYQAIYNNATHA